MSKLRRQIISDNLSTSRIQAFSDGVFAIAMTLLVLQVTVPEIPNEALVATKLPRQLLMMIQIYDW